VKRKKNLLILLIALVVVAGAYFGISALSKDEDADKAEITVPVLDNVKKEDITGISWNYEGNKIDLVKEGSAWVCAQDKAFPLEQNFPESMSATISELTSTRFFEDVENMADYGLENPSHTITVKLQNGEETTISVGAQNAVTSEYYVSKSGENDVYLVESGFPASFRHSMYDMVQYEILPVMSDIKTFTVKKGEEEFEIEHIDEGEITQSGKYAWFTKVDGEYQPLDTSKTVDFINGLKRMQWTSCEEYNASDEKLELYGLSEPRAVVTAVYKETADTGNGASNGGKIEKSFSVIIGKAAGESCYVMISGSKMVYFINESTAQTLLSGSYGSLKP